MTYRIGKPTIILATLATIFYLISWTGTSIIVGALAAIFESFSFLASMRDGDKPDDEGGENIQKRRDEW
ncbi:hypothetical protein JCM19000A_05510 [Silvimonas sp. JCM 19000]